MGVKEPSAWKVSKCYRENNLLSPKPPSWAAVYPRNSLSRKPGGILCRRWQEMQTSELDLAILGCSHTDFQGNVIYAQYAFLRCMAWLCRCWGKTLVLPSYGDFMPVSVHYWHNSCQKEESRWRVFCPQTQGVNHVCLKGVCFKIWGKKYIVGTMHHSGNNLTAKLCSQQNLTQV